MRHLAIFLVIGIFVLSGCTSTSKSTGMNTILEPQAILRFGDVPVPVGFKLLLNDSYAFESAGTRVGVLKYYGKADADRLVEFYKAQMPIYDWNLLNVVEYGERLLNFERDDEICIISLLPKFNLFRLNYLLATISIGPKSQRGVRSSKEILGESVRGSVKSPVKLIK
ncbi:MAG: hypothetical protein KJ793_05185 [Candidatus Omnitrophica bacterium]|nr:hypothetical protein [Candidatus Omnitrophota bacterium]